MTILWQSFDPSSPGIFMSAVRSTEALHGTAAATLVPLFHGYSYVTRTSFSYSASLAFLTPQRSSAREARGSAITPSWVPLRSRQKWFWLFLSSGETSLRFATIVPPNQGGHKDTSSADTLSDAHPNFQDSDRRNASCQSIIVMLAQDWTAALFPRSDCVVMHHLSPA